MLTDKDGKQDAKEDDDEEDQLHVVEPCVECQRPARNIMHTAAGSGGYGITEALSRALGPDSGMHDHYGFLILSVAKDLADPLESWARAHRTME